MKGEERRTLRGMQTTVTPVTPGSLMLTERDCTWGVSALHLGGPIRGTGKKGAPGGLGVSTPGAGRRTRPGSLREGGLGLGSRSCGQPADEYEHRQGYYSPDCRVVELLHPAIRTEIVL